ncbi:MAG: response regulator [Acidobacteriia bacterium]|nr:response regulator [Terriglobia bacterium]
MKLFRNLSIQRKLAAVILATSCLALALASVGFVIYQRASFRTTMISELSTLADTLGANTAASLMFNDRKSAHDMLGALGGEKHIIAACLYDNEGKIFTEYRRPELADSFEMPASQGDGAQFDSEHLRLSRNVSLQGTKVGSITIISDLGLLHTAFRQYARISALVLVVSIFLAFVVSSQLLRVITAPILELARIAGGVSTQKDYSLRAVPRGNDEVGTLVSSFNQMLEDIQQRDAALQSANEELENRVLKRTEEMRRAKDAAEEASRVKSEFLANMSHEIRTPLNGIMGMTDLALGTEITTEQHEYLDTVKQSADSLLVVINDILDFSKIEAGKADLEVVDFNLRNCLESTMKMLAFRADEKGLELLCEIAPEVPEVVRGDSSRLRQIVTNLVGNAIKFTNEGEVAMKVEVKSQGDDNRTLQFTVSDTGIGIPPEKQALIFAPFSQADTSTTRKYGGTGLGLTISARLVELMEGRIWLESEVGRGTHFFFTVQLKSSEMPSAVGNIAPPEILRGVKVLVVDDNSTNRRILDGMLRRWEMRPTLVEGGEGALAELSAAREAVEPYGLILTDMHMPKMDGFSLVERIRQRPELATATIMMLTSAGHRGDAERCKQLGVAAYLLKPIRQSELREAIAQVLGAREQTGAIPLVTRYSLQDARDPMTVLRILAAEDNPVNQLLMIRLLEKRGHRVVLAVDGRQAIEALNQGSFDLVLMDVQMPEMDGLEATAIIREKEKKTGKHQPIIALTAHAMTGDRDRCLAAGMDGYLTKPIRPQELDQILESYVNRRISVPEVLNTK